MFKFVLIILIIITVFSLSAFCEDCGETVVIRSVEYDVGEFWCGKQLDSVEVAYPDVLMRLLPEHCFNNSRIFNHQESYKAFFKMAEAAYLESIFLKVKSGFRSMGYQRMLITKRLDAGEKIEDIFKMVAPPSYSRHETGMAYDLAVDSGSFAESDVYKWLLENANKYGFYETYPKENDNGIHWEPWHWEFQKLEMPEDANITSEKPSDK